MLIMTKQWGPQCWCLSSQVSGAYLQADLMPQKQWWATSATTTGGERVGQEHVRREMIWKLLHKQELEESLSH